MNSQNTYRVVYRLLISSGFGLGLLSCAESLPEQQPAQVSESNVNNRAFVVNRNIQEVFGSGYFPQNTTQGIPAFGFIGNTGGFGFSGSIASIIGNSGGFGGFGGFGSFASFLAGSLPTSPPAGFIPPPGTGNAPIPAAPPNVGGGFTTPPGGFGPPPGSFTAPGGGFAPPAGFTPPAAGFAPPAGFSPPVSNPPAGLVNNNQLAQFDGMTQQINFVDRNLAETNSALSNSDLDFIFVSPSASNSLVSPLAITETVTPCSGGGTRTFTVDDVDPVGPSSGDSRTTTFADCVRGANGGMVINGSRGFRTDSMVGMAFIDPVWSTQTSMFQDNLTRTSAAYTSSSNGTTTNSISVDELGITQSASGGGDTSRTNTNTNTGYSHTYAFNTNFAWDNVTQTFTISFDINIDSVAVQNSSISVETTTPMTGVAGASPTAGQVTIVVGVDNVNTQIRTLTAQADGTVLVETDTNADGVIDTTANLPNWSATLFELFNAPI